MKLRLIHQCNDTPWSSAYDLVQVSRVRGGSSLLALDANVVSEVPTTADYNYDGAITPADLSAFLADWGDGLPLADVQIDGTVNGLDFTLYMARYDEATNTTP